MSSISETASIIARDILKTVSSINDQFKIIHEDPREALLDRSVFTDISKLSDILYSKITNHYDESPDAFQLAVKKVFTFPSRFKKPATLEIILCFTYKMIFAYEQNFMCDIIKGTDHGLYAFKMQNGHVETIKKLLKD